MQELINREVPFKVALWGLGEEYNSLLNILKVWEMLGEIEIVALTAKELPDVSKIDGWRVIHRNKLQRLDIDYLVICNICCADEIIKEAVSLGIERGKIILSRVLKIPYFNWKNYIDIKESRLSIISCNCWGGVFVSHIRNGMYVSL